MVITGRGTSSDYVISPAAGEIVTTWDNALTSYEAMSGGMGKEEGDCYFTAELGASTGVGVKTSGCAITGVRVKTVVSLAASENAFFYIMAVGAFVATANDLTLDNFVSDTN